jgi:hypothetical protein
METSQIISIAGESDIIAARMRVRRFAYAAGFGPKDQACISLAASSLAYALALGSTRPGRMTVDSLSEKGLVGVRVVCTTVPATDDDMASEGLGNTRCMVDELTVEPHPQNELRVTIIKWGEPE